MHISNLCWSFKNQIPYNMERIWYLLTGGNCSLIKNLMAEFEDTGGVLLPNEIKEAVRRVMVVSDEEIRQTIKRTWDTHSYLVCPHTATGVTYHYQQFERYLKRLFTPLIYLNRYYLHDLKDIPILSHYLT